MKRPEFLVLAILFAVSPPCLARADFDEGSAEQVLELASVLSDKLEHPVENALRNAIEYAIWSLDERPTSGSQQALANLLGIRLGASGARDRDCAILKRGASMLQPLSSADAIVRWCVAKASEINVKPEQVCLGPSDVKQSVALLSAAIATGRRCAG